MATPLETPPRSWLRWRRFRRAPSARAPPQRWLSGRLQRAAAGGAHWLGGAGPGSPAGLLWRWRRLTFSEDVRQCRDERCCHSYALAHSGVARSQVHIRLQELEETVPRFYGSAKNQKQYHRLSSLFCSQSCAAGPVRLPCLPITVQAELGRPFQRQLGQQPRHPIAIAGG